MNTHLGNLIWRVVRGKLVCLQGEYQQHNYSSTIFNICNTSVRPVGLAQSSTQRDLAVFQPAILSIEPRACIEMFPISCGISNCCCSSDGDGDCRRRHAIVLLLNQSPLFGHLFLYQHQTDENDSKVAVPYTVPYTQSQSFRQEKKCATHLWSQKNAGANVLSERVPESSIPVAP